MNTRESLREESWNFGPVHFSSCRWINVSGTAPNPYKQLAVTISHYEPDSASSGVASAARSYDFDRADMSSPHSLAGVGDEAVFSSDAGSAVVLARKANITVLMRARFDIRYRTEDAASLAVQALTAAIIADVHLDSTERRGER